ncbi:MAG: AAA family ATPase [Actinobacteria bacterium]|nr:AAA family ATPase [Actinomycetota bacterium]
MLRAMPARTISPTFVGRSAEMSRLEGSRARAAGGEPSIVLVGGDAGVGKTRLLAEFIASVRDALVLSGGCIDLGEAALPYAPVVEAFRELAPALGADRVRTLPAGPRRDLARLLPGTGADPPPDGGEPASQSRLFEAILSTLEALGRERPVVLAIEDLHWADRSTLDVVVFLARNLGDARVLVVATYRTDELHRRHHLGPVLAELSRLPSVDRLDVVPFDRGELVEQLTAILGRDPETDLVEVIADRSEGNAFYAEELLAATERSGGPLPATLRDILASRLAPLPETAQEVLRIAAAAARSVDHRLLEEVAGLPAAELRDGLREAVAHQVLVATEDGRGYRFRHALLQEAVHEELLPGERTGLHAAFAAALTRDPDLAAAGSDGVHAELAHHWYAAHELELAFTHSFAAAETALGQYAFAEARHHYERVLELWDRVPEEARTATAPRHDVLGRAARACNLAGDARRALAHQREAIAAARDGVSAEVSAGQLARLAQLLWFAGEGAEALAVSEAALAAMPAEPSRDRAYALALWGRLLMLGGRHEDAIGPSREAVAVARAVGAVLEESQALNSLGTSLAAAQDLEAGVALLRESLRLATDVGGVGDVLRGYINLGHVLSAAAARGGGSATVEESRLWDEAIAVSEEGLRWAEDRGLVGPATDFLRLNLVDDLHFRGRWDEADRHIDLLRPRAFGGAAGAHAALTVGRIRIGQGRFDEAHALLRGQDTLGEDVADAHFLIPIAEAEASLALWEGRSEDARRTADRVMELPDRPVWMDLVVPLAAWAEADLAGNARVQGDASAEQDAHHRVARLVGVLRDALTEEDDPGSMWSERLRGLLLQVEAERTRLAGDPDPEAWRQAAAWLDEHGHAAVVVYAGWRLAEALLARDRRDEATEVLRSAHVRATELGAGAVRDRLEALARRARVVLPGIVTAGDDEFGLTPREREVLELVADGMTNRGIAERLFIAEKTASVHVSNILAKLGVPNRGEAAAVAHRLGLDTHL